MFLYLKDRNQIHLLYLLDKDEQEDLSADERKVLRAWVSETKRSREGDSKFNESQGSKKEGPDF